MLLWNLRILAQIAICHELRVFCAILGGIFFVCAILYAFSISAQECIQTHDVFDDDDEKF